MPAGANNLLAIVKPADHAARCRQEVSSTLLATAKERVCRVVNHSYHRALVESGVPELSASCQWMAKLISLFHIAGQEGSTET